MDCKRIGVYEMKSKIIKKLTIARRIFYIICAVAILATVFFGYQAYDKKNNYYNSEYGFMNENAYVGGDAYNYIINAEYFAGYVTASSASAVTAVFSFGCSVMLMCMESYFSRENEKNSTKNAEDQRFSEIKVDTNSHKKVDKQTWEQVIKIITIMAALIFFIFLYAEYN